MTRRQKQILQRLADEGTLTQADLNARTDTLHELWLKGWAEGRFGRSGRTPDDRYWAITKQGREAIR